MAKYDGWAVKMPNGKIHSEHYGQKRSKLIFAVESSCPKWHWWEKLRQKGYKAVKVRLVEVK